MNHVAWEQLEERSEKENTPLDLALLTGTWINTNASPRLIRRIQFAGQPNQLRMHVYGASPDLPEDWKEAQALPFAERPGLPQAMAISARFEVATADVRLQGYVVKGVLVIVSFTQWKDGSRSNTFGKEFFYRAAS